jgi:hypothetical protein
LCGAAAGVASASSSLTIGVAQRDVNWEASCYKEAFHEQEVHCSFNRL